MLARCVLSLLCFAVLTLSEGKQLIADGNAIAYRPHIRKLLRQHCEACHNPSRAEAGLDLSNYASVIDGSSSGRILVEGDPEDSLLYLVMKHEAEPAMPPNKKLRGKEVELIHSWIMNGLPEVPEDAQSQEHVMATKKEMVATTGELESQVDESHDDTTLVFQGQRSGPVTAMAVAQGKKLLAVAGQQQVLLFDLREFKFLRALPFPEGEVFALRFSSDESILLAGGGRHAQSGSVVAWNAMSGDRLRAIGEERDIVLAADITADYSSIALGGPGRTVTVYDVAASSEKFSLNKHTDWIFDIRFSPDGLIFTSTDRAGNVFVWESESGELLHTLRGQVGAVMCTHWSADGNVAITGGDDGFLRLHDMHSGQLLRQWKAHDKGILCLDASSESTLVTSGRDKVIRHWTLDGRLLSELNYGDAFPLHVRFTSGEQVAIGDSMGQVQIANLNPAGLVERLSIPSNIVTNDISKAVPDLSSLAILKSDNPLDSLNSKMQVSRADAEPNEMLARTEDDLADESRNGVSESIERVIRLGVLERQLGLALRAFETEKVDSDRYKEAQVLTKIAFEKIRLELSEAQSQVSTANSEPSAPAQTSD